jgi:hypothetical protein
MSAITILLTALAQIASVTGEASTIASIVSTLEQIIAAGIEEVETVAPMIKNIIAALQSNTAVTADQMTQLSTLDASTDAAFEAAAAAAGAAPDPDASTSSSS